MNCLGSCSLYCIFSYSETNTIPSKMKTIIVSNENYSLLEFLRFYVIHKFYV